MQFGMISWFVPLSTYPAGYGGNQRNDNKTMAAFSRYGPPRGRRLQPGPTPVPLFSPASSAV
jgi:hypothetical protein